MVPATPVVPPPNIVPGSPYAEVVRLTQAGVDESIVTTYVQNSTSLFNLDSDKIIYLSNLGAPNSLVTAMMQRDQQLQQQFAATRPRNRRNRPNRHRRKPPRLPKPLRRIRQMQRRHPRRTSQSRLIIFTTRLRLTAVG